MSMSAAGVGVGGRTGLTSVVVALLFLGSLFLAPLVESIPIYATAPAILYVACLMARSVERIDWANITESAPAVITAIAVPLTYSIADGIGIGILVYIAVKAMAGRGARLSRWADGRGDTLRREVRLALRRADAIPLHTAQSARA